MSDGYAPEDWSAHWDGEKADVAFGQSQAEVCWPDGEPTLIWINKPPPGTHLADFERTAIDAAAHAVEDSD